MEFIPNSKKVTAGSTRAICGSFEREIVVPRLQVQIKMNQLKNRGFSIVGRSINKTGPVTIWFNPSGVLL